MATLILTPTRKNNCGMFNLAKNLDGDIFTLMFSNPVYRLFPVFDFYRFWKVMLKGYDEIITFIYPMHLFGRQAKSAHVKWIVYDQKIPPARLFKNFFRRQYIKLFTFMNNWSQLGASNYWELSEIEQELTTTRRKKHYAIYLGRTEGYKNFTWLKATMKRLGIPLEHPVNDSDDLVFAKLSNAKLLVTASEWEGYGRPVAEAQIMGIPTVCFDTGTHKQHCTHGIVVENGNKYKFEQAIIKLWNKQ